LFPPLYLPFKFPHVEPHLLKGSLKGNLTITLLPKPPSLEQNHKLVEKIFAKTIEFWVAKGSNV